MHKKIWCFLLVVLFVANQDLRAQNRIIPPQKYYKVAVFAPLFLDSVFSDYKLRSDNTIPKFIMPGVEFVQGALIAFDTLSLYDDHVEATIYDTRSYTQPVS